MHVAFVVTETREWRSLAPSRERELTRRLAERMAAAGHDVTVFCTQFWDGYESALRREGVTYEAVTVAPAKASFTTRLAGQLALERPHVVHAAPQPPSAVVAARVGARLASAPLVVGWEGHELPTGRLLGRAARAPDGVVVPSGLVGTRARKAGTPERRVRDIPQAIDVDRIESVDPTGDYDVVTATPLDEHANLDGLLLALAELRRRDWSALVVDTSDAPTVTRRRAVHTDGGADGSVSAPVDGSVGESTTDSSRESTADDEGEDEAGADPSPRAELAEQLSDLRIADRVTVADGMGREERLAHYRGAHVFVQTRAHEPFARELLWALASGCVGIVEYQAGSSAHELLVDHPRGFRVTTPEEIETAIEDAAEMERRTADPEMRRYDWETVVEEYVEFYRELATA